MNKIYELKIDEDNDKLGINILSFVDNPAIKTEWFTFSEQETVKKDLKKQMITSPIMLANSLIKRDLPNIGMFEVFYSEETIMQMMIQFMSSDKKDNVDFQHNKELIEGIKLVESYIVDERNSSNIFDVPKGSWIGTFYIEDKELYNKLVEDPNFNGISLDGIFKMEEVMVDMIYEAIIEVVSSDLDDELKVEKLKSLYNEN